ncbi:MAG: chemotaxis protein CheX [Nitrospina sp.]|nr:chemotaxis protein CheX [Nitrospina sp.]
MPYEFKTDSIPEELAACVNNSVLSIFETMFGKAPVSEDASSNSAGEGVVGIISFVGDITWLLMVTLPKKSAESLAFKFAGFDLAYDSPEMGDVVGELANVLAGDIVARLANDEVKVAMSLPTIMKGHNVEPLLPRGVPSHMMQFTLDDDEVFVKIAGAREGLGKRPGT